MKPLTGSKKQKNIIALIVSILLVTGCSGQSKSESSTTFGSSNNSGGTLVIGLTAANLPVPDTIPTEGFEGMRFVGYQLYDGLTGWDLSHSDKPASIKPGLAESWEVSETDPTLWTVHLRKNVTFHDGTPFNADAVVFAFERLLNQQSPYYNAQMAGGSAGYTGKIESYQKVDDYTVNIKTKGPNSFLPYDLAIIVIPSPDAVKKSGQDYTNHPVGTGPFKFVSMKLGQEMVMERNDQYWGTKAKLDRIVLRPISDPSARLAALQSGEVDWAEVPPTESIAPLKSAGYQLLTNPYPHVMPYVLNLQKGPWANKKVRQAANYAIDREGMSKNLLNGAAMPSTQFVYKGDPWYNDKVQPYQYDPEKAKKLLAEAGYPNGFQTTFLVPTGGSGNMWPLQMNEYVQQNLKAVGIDVKIQSMEWQTLFTQYFQGFPDGVDGINLSLNSVIPSFFNFFFSTEGFVNIGKYSNPQVDDLLVKAINAFDNEQRDSLLREASGIIADDAPWLFVVHDLNLRALSPKVKGFVQPQSWFADLTSVSIQ